MKRKYKIKSNLLSIKIFILYLDNIINMILIPAVFMGVNNYYLFYLISLINFLINIFK